MQVLMPGQVAEGFQAGLHIPPPWRVTRSRSSMSAKSI